MLLSELEDLPLETTCNEMFIIHHGHANDVGATKFLPQIHGVSLLAIAQIIFESFVQQMIGPEFAIITQTIDGASVQKTSFVDGAAVGNCLDKSGGFITIERA